MAKMRVYEIAKELDAPSKEILDFLQEKGVEAKTASSNIDDDIIAMVRGKFSAGGGICAGRQQTGTVGLYFPDGTDCDHQT